jgi:hypothetical protein
VDKVPQELLEQTAAQALLVSDGARTSFEIDFRDEMFPGLSCRIEVAGARVRAVFRAGDANTRRLLEGEAARLRSQLEARGLRVDAVGVET